MKFFNGFLKIIKNSILDRNRQYKKNWLDYLNKCLSVIEIVIDRNDDDLKDGENAKKQLKDILNPKFIKSYLSEEMIQNLVELEIISP